MLTATPPLTIRTYTDADYEGVLDLLRDCYAGIDDQLPSCEDMQLLAALCPEGQIVAVEEGRVAGAILSLLVRYDHFNRQPVLKDLYNPANFKSMGEGGDSLFALEILVHSQYKRRGIGKALNTAMAQLLEQKQLKAFIGVSRLPGYGALQQEMPVDTYIEKVVCGHLADPSLSYNCSNNMLPVRAVPGYYPPDTASAGYGVLVIQHNQKYIYKSMHDFINGPGVLQQLPAGSVLTAAEQARISKALEQLPFTFEYPNMPSCWGKAFENYLTMQEYLAPHPDDAAVAALAAPAIQRITEMLQGLGLQVEPLVDAVTGQPYPTGNFRLAGSNRDESLLHVDDLRLDGAFKSDFVLPQVLQDYEYVQMLVFVLLGSKGAHTALRVYNKQYNPEHSSFLLENGWQFDSVVVNGADFNECHPQPGDAFIMKNQFFHDILSTGAANEWCMYSTYVLHVPALNKAFLYN